MPAELGPHNLTTNNSTPPFAVAASTEAANGGFPAYLAFDGSSTADGWIGGINPPSWLSIDLGSTQLLGSYTIQAGRAGQQGTARAPQTWTMQGSPDNYTWNTVDTRESEVGWAAEESRTYVCTTLATPYRFFRLAFVLNNGDSQYVQILELSLFQGIATGTPLIELGPHDLSSYTSHAPFVVSESGEAGSGQFPGWKAFNGDASSAWFCTIGGTPQWLMLDLGGLPQFLGSYSIQVTTDTANAAAAPRDFSMAGSNDKATWTQLDARTNETNWNRGGTRNYVCSAAPTRFRYFRLTITASQNNAVADVAELSLFLGGLLNTGGAAPPPASAAGAGIIGGSVT